MFVVCKTCGRKASRHSGRKTHRHGHKASRNGRKTHRHSGHKSSRNGRSRGGGEFFPSFSEMVAANQTSPGQTIGDAEIADQLIDTSDQVDAWV